MPPRLISRAELASIAGVSRTAITKACKKQLAAACVDDRVDGDHESVRKYLASKGAKLPPAPAARAAAKPSKKRESKSPRSSVPPPSINISIDDDDDDDASATIESHKELTLEALVDRFGSKRRYKDWLEALKKIEDIRKTRLDNDETEGRLIDRELIKTHIFGAFEAAFRRLLTDVPKTATRLIYEKAKSGVPVEQAELLLRERIQNQLKPVKATAERVLRRA